MPEPKIVKYRKNRRKKTVKAKPRNLLCHVHDEAGTWKSNVNQNICVSNEEYPLTEFEGKLYCLFHLPTKVKDKDKFENLVWAFMKQIWQENSDRRAIIGNQNINLKKIDFRYFFFPDIFILSEQDIENKIDFSFATFANDANFWGTKFYQNVDFNNTKFCGKVFFNSSTEFREYVDFQKAIFEETVLFNNTKFFKTPTFNLVQFKSYAQFIQSEFHESASFANARFENDSDFFMASFNSVSFDNAIFLKTVSFRETTFNERTSFIATTFDSDSDTRFEKSIVNATLDLKYSNSKGYLRFSNLKQGKDCKFDFQEATFEKASRVSFHTVRLEPNWFVNVDPRKFVFTDIDWGKTIGWRGGRSYWEKLKFAGKCIASGFRQVFWKSDEILSTNIDGELERLEERGIKEQKKRLLEIACRQLAVNAEENNRYSEASQFRYMAMETKRLENEGIWRFVNLHWFYKWTSGYGESWRRAFVVLVAILAIFGFLYSTPLAKFDYGEKPPKKVEGFVQQVCELATMKGNAGGLNGCDSAFYSLAVSALQKPEPKPADSLTKILVILQTILAPLQAALLALAIRRKFMR